MDRSSFVNIILMILYRIGYFIGFVAVLPKLVWSRVVCGKRQNVRRRLFPKIRYPVPGAGPLVWVHAVSVGEVYAVSPVVKALLRANPEFRIVVSTVTQTGHETAKKAIPEAEAHVFLPFDFRFSIRRVLSLGTPSLVIFSEGDLWPLFLHEVKRGGAVVAIVNGKISDRTAARYGKVKCIFKWLHSYVDIFCVQNQTFYDRFAALGVSEHRLHITGNTKADINFPILSSAERKTLRVSLGLADHDRLIIVASTHSPEEQELLVRLLPILNTHPDVKIAIVPRHPERFGEVFRSAKEKSDSVVLLSSYHGICSWKIMIVDKLGVLTKLYQVATIAIVGGSFTDRIGGHNILEPAAVHVPVIVGPYMHSQPMLFQSAQAANAIFQVSYDTLQETVEHLLNDQEFLSNASGRAFLWADALRGATDRTAKILLERI